MLAPGQVIDRYELVCHVGDGGMAHVWAARQRGAHGFAKLVALKIIQSRFAEDPTFRRMFLDEARIVSAIHQRNVAHVVDLGETDSLLYLVMEYVDGDSLFSLIAPQSIVPVPIALRIAAEACAGLHAAHSLLDERGRRLEVVHRDVSPQNVLLAANGDVKLIDFGIAHARDRAATTTDPGSVRGKVRYMAPEQARRTTLGPYTDVFGLGATLFRMLAGKAPWAAEDDTATLQALIAGEPPLHRLPRDLSSRIAATVQRAIAVDVRERYADARQFGEALETLLDGEARPDLAGWVETNLGERARARRASLGRAAGDGSTRGRRVDEIRSFGPAVRPPTAEETRDSDAPPAFMDIGALAARAREEAEAPPEPPADEAHAGVRADGSRGALPERRKATMARAPRRLGERAALKIALASIVVVLAAVAFLLYLPSLVRSRVVARARDVGIDLRIERTGVDLGGVSLRDVDATLVRAPGVTAHIREVRVDGIAASSIRVLGLDIRARGRRSALETEVATLIADARTRFAGAPTRPRHLSLVQTRLAWDDDGALVTASDIGAEVDSRGAGVEEVHASIGKLEVKTSTTTFGPWSSAYERNATNARLRLMFDPGVPDGPSALVVWTRSLPTTFTLKIPRTTFRNLGIHPTELGLPATDDTDVQLDLAATSSDTARSELAIDAAIWGARPKGFSGPVDLRLEGSGARVGSRPYELEKTTVAVGAFVANVSGTVTPHPAGGRLEATFKTVPMPCEKLARAEAKTMGPLAATLQALGQATKALRFTGTVNAAGRVEYDTASPGDASVTWLAKETCGLSIFGM